MSAKKNRVSLNNTENSSFRWSKCSKCSKYLPNEIQHDCSAEINGIFLDEDRARLFLHEHKTEYFKEFSLPSFFHSDVVFCSNETMNFFADLLRHEEILLISQDKNQQPFIRTGFVWPQPNFPQDQISISKNLLEQLADRTTIEIRKIRSNSIENIENVTLRIDRADENRSSNERRLIAACLKHQLANRIVFFDQKIDFVYLGQTISFRVEKSMNFDENFAEMSIETKIPQRFFRISPSFTSIEIEFDLKTTKIRTTTFDDLGGLKKEKKLLQDFFIDSTSPRGILLYGPKGCGKTMLIDAFSQELDAKILRIHPAEIYSRHYGESETKLKEIFAQTKKFSKKKTFLIVENIESLCPHQERITQQLERRLTTTFIDLLDRNLDGTNLLLIATTNRIDAVDTDLRRPGRLDEEIEIGIPNQNDRFDILKVQLRTISNDLNDEQLKTVAERTHGFSGSDLENLCRKANRFGRKNVTFEDFDKALAVVRPSSMREVILEVPKVKWSDIGGQHELKKRLEEMVVWPLKYADALDRLNVQVPKGILMYGPPGCSKTMVAKAIATESGLNFIAVKGPELFNKWVGESERAIRELFRRARLAAPAIIFFDEIDAIANARSTSSNSNVSDRVIATLLIEMDGIEKLKGVTIIAATNRPDCIDPALMRPGRFDRLVFVPLPDEKTRAEIFQIRFQRSPIDPNIRIEDLVLLTNKYSGAEIAAVCDEAALIALRDNINAVHIEWKHFQQALNAIQPRTSDEHLRKLEMFSKQHGK